MRQCLAKLAIVFSAGGCSIIYNANNIHMSDATPDVVADADPTMLELISVAPPTIYEGQGAKGDGAAASRSAVIVISGHQMVKDQTTVAVTVHPGQPKNPTVTVDNTQLDVSADGDLMAVPIAVAQDDMLAATDSIRFDVSVTQNTVNGPVTKMLSALDNDAAVLIVQGLGELKGVDATITPTNPPTLYSRVNLTGKLIAAASATMPIVIRSTTSIKIALTSQFNASGLTPGVYGGYGGTGGPGGLVGGNAGMAGGGPMGGQPSGGVGRYIGTDQITSLAELDGNSSSGGAGGNGNGALMGGPGGNGGAGGGSVEITAGGDLVVGGVEAKGAAGAAGSSGANPGGAGTGGVVLLRAGTSVSVTGSIDVSGGGGGADPGRARIDAPNMITGGTLGTFYQGPTFVTATPLIVRSKTASVTVINQSQRNLQYYINNADGSDSHGPVTVLTPQNSMAQFSLNAGLFKGLNQVCAIVESAHAGVAAAGQCIQIVWLP